MNGGPSAIDLILLGFLWEGDRSPYQMARSLTERQVARFLKISAPAVYKRCKTLSAEGLLDATVSRDGPQPEKTIYSLNSAGRARFYELMKHFSSNLAPLYLDSNTFIWNLEKLEKPMGLEMLNAMREGIAELHEWLVQHEAANAASTSFSTRAIMKQYRMLFATLLQWSEDVIDDYKQSGEP